MKILKKKKNDKYKKKNEVDSHDRKDDSYCWHSRFWQNYLGFELSGRERECEDCRTRRFATQIAGNRYHTKSPEKKIEGRVSQLQDRIIRDALAGGKTVVVSNTNLNRNYVQGFWQLAKIYNADFELKYFDEDPDVCRVRNLSRDRVVPDFVMNNFIDRAYANGHLKEYVFGSNNSVSFVPLVTEGSLFVENVNEHLNSLNPFENRGVVFLDCDGTLFDNQADSYRYINNNNRKKNFDAFYRSIKNARVNRKVLDMVNKMHEDDGLDIFVVTGRTDDYAEVLTDAVLRSGVLANRIIMKRAGDNRPSCDHKRDVLHKVRNSGIAVVHAIDDRDKDLNMFIAEGVLTSVVFSDRIPSDVAEDFLCSLREPDVSTLYGTGYCIRCGSQVLDETEGNIHESCRI